MAPLTRSTYGLDSGSELDWRQHGVCGTGTYPADLWTSPSDTDLGQARWVCLRQCPVQAQCFAWAMAREADAAGAVYGGYYFAMRRGHEGPPRLARHQPDLVQPGAVPVAVRPDRPRVGANLTTAGRPRRSVCGTVAGYQSHRRDRTETCEPCAEAKRENGRQYRAERKAS